MSPTTDQERAIIAEAEQVMNDAMAKYDPSHDAFHGAFKTRLCRVELPTDA
jgi:hypothetical protein